MQSRRTIGICAIFIALAPVLGCNSGDGTTTPVTAQIQGEGEAANSTATAKTPTPKKDEGDPLHPIVQIQTSLGNITLQLDADHAPGTVRNFLNYVNGSQYDQTVFHYVDSSSMILGGGFDANLEPRQPAPPIRNEAHNGLKNVTGTIVMSRPFDSIDGATSQFFINTNDNPALDHQGPTEEEYGYCVFGKVTSGMEVVNRISQVEVTTEGDFVNTPKERVVIQSIRFVR